MFLLPLSRDTSTQLGTIIMPRVNMIYYYPQIVQAHGNNESSAFLMNEAPGPCEAFYLVPSIGDQGGNIYRAFRRAKIRWATDFIAFSWPKKILEKYVNPFSKSGVFKLRDAFLEVRAKYMTCSNSYDKWPRSGPDALDFINPTAEDVLSHANIERIKKEISPNHRVLLICGEFAWLACLGSMLENPAIHEGRQLSEEELKIVNQRFSSSFASGWYMGHTRRWSLNTEKISTELKSVAKAAGWIVED